MKRLQTIREVVDLLGGSCKVARITGRHSQAISNWLARDYIPASAFDDIDKAVRRKRHTADRALFGFDARRRRADAA